MNFPPKCINSLAEITGVGGIKKVVNSRAKRDLKTCYYRDLKIVVLGVDHEGYMNSIRPVKKFCLLNS